MGCANPEGATGWNIARQIAIRAGCPVTAPGMTVNRFCSSGLQTIAIAAQRIIAGEGDVFVAGGVESISLRAERDEQAHVQDEWLHRAQAARSTGRCCRPPSTSPGATTSRASSRTSTACSSQQRAAEARAAGKFNDEIAPITTKMKVVDKATGTDSIQGGHGVRRTKASAPTPPTRACRRSSRRSRAA